MSFKKQTTQKTARRARRGRPQKKNQKKSSSSQEPRAPKNAHKKKNKKQKNQKNHKNNLTKNPELVKTLGEHDALTACAFVLVRVYKLFNICEPEPSTTNKVVETTVRNWLRMSEDIGWIKFVKYKLAAFFAHHLGQALPEKPSSKLDDDLPGVLLGGVFHRSCRAFFNRHKMIKEDADLDLVSAGDLRRCTQRLEFLSTVLNSKGGMPLASLDEKAAKVDKTVTKLTTPGEPKKAPEDAFQVSWADRKKGINYELNDFALCDELRRTVREVFKGVKYTYSDRTRLLFPSTRSNSYSSMAEGGTVGTLMEKKVLDEFRVPGGPMGPIQKLDQAYRTEEGSEVTDSSQGMIDNKLPYYTYDRDALKRTYTEAWQKLLHLAEKEEALVKPVGLLEALKIRVISKGPPLTYMVLKSLQKKLHAVLRHERCFQLVGKPDDPWVLQEILGKLQAEGEYYLSGDYTAATDNFRTLVSNTIADELSIVLELDEREKVLFKRALTGHLFEHKGKTLPQRSGQLMGSIVSFPVLCLGNFAIARWALEVATGKRQSAHSTPIGVNGDDLVMRGPKTLRGIWSTIGRFAGLEESVGKTFFSKKFCNINSRTYLRTKPILTDFDSPTKGLIERELVFKKTSFVNMGILLGHKKSVNPEELNMFDKRFNASAVSHALVNEAPEHMRQKLFATWLGGNKEQLDKIGLPWFIPEWLGGIGLPMEFGESDALDLKIARRIIMNYKRERPMRLSNPGSPWFIRQVAERALPPVETFLSPEAEPVKALERLQGDLAMNLLFDSNVPLEEIFREVRGNPFKGALKHNRKLWKRHKSKKGKQPKLGGKKLDVRLLQGAKRYPGLYVKAERDHKWPMLAERAKSLKEIAYDLKLEDELEKVWTEVQDQQPTPRTYTFSGSENEHNYAQMYITK